MIPFNFDIDSEWVTENMEITYFIQDNDTKEILQGDFIDVGDYILGIANATANAKGMVYPNPAENLIDIVNALFIFIICDCLLDSLNRRLDIKNCKVHQEID